MGRREVTMPLSSLFCIERLFSSQRIRVYPDIRRAGGLTR